MFQISDLQMQMNLWLLLLNRLLLSQKQAIAPWLIEQKQNKSSFKISSTSNTRKKESMIHFQTKYSHHLLNKKEKPKTLFHVHAYSTKEDKAKTYLKRHLSKRMLKMKKKRKMILSLINHHKSSKKQGVHFKLCNNKVIRKLIREYCRQ